MRMVVPLMVSASFLGFFVTKKVVADTDEEEGRHCGASSLTTLTSRAAGKRASMVLEVGDV